MKTTKGFEYQKKSEALLVNQIDDSLKKYMLIRDLNYISYAPPSTDQNFSNLDKYCGDIVASFGTISALVLEVKLNTRGRLNDLNIEQNSGLIELHSRGVPVFYSYNFIELDDFPNDPEKQLLKVSAVKPEDQKNQNPIEDETCNLLTEIKRLLDKPPSNANIAMALAYFINPKSSIINSGIEKLTTKTLLIIYDKENHNLLCLDQDSASLIIQQIMSEKYKSENKNAEILADTINELLKNWRHQIQQQMEKKIIKNNNSSRQMKL